MSTNPIRVFVGAKARLYCDGQVLILLAKEGWDLPGGRINAGEFGRVDLLQVLRREIQEETGLRAYSEPELLGVTQWVRPPRRNETRSLKRIFVVHYGMTVNRSSVRISGEHSQYRWVDVDEAERLLPEGLRLDLRGRATMPSDARSA